MPLFDAIESDVTAFFVSQGTVFDSLVKAFMDRMTAVESRVELLRSDVTHNFNVVNQRIDANSVAATEVAAAAAVAATSAALAALPVSVAEYASASPVVATVVDPGGGRNDEFEYYVMTLSRQLNMVLEVLFQPHGNNNVVEVVQAKQTQMYSISDVLTENEAILMQLAAQHDEFKLQHIDSEAIPGPDSLAGHERTGGGFLTVPADVEPANSTPDNPTPKDKPRKVFDVSSDPVPTDNSRKESIHPQEPINEVSSVGVRADPPKEGQRPQTPSNVQKPDTSSLPSVASEATRNISLPVEQQEALTTEAQPSQQIESLREVAETISPHLDASPLTKKEVVDRTVNSPPDNQNAPDQLDEDDDDDEERDQMPVVSSSFRAQASHAENPLHRKKSFFRNCQDLQRLEEERLREQRRREEELMRRMHELFHQSRSHVQHEHMEVWRQQQDEVTQNQQTLISHLQAQLQEQLQAQQQREQEWRREQEEQRQTEIATIHHEVDRKLETFNSLVVAAQATQGHEIAQVLIADIEKRFVSPDTLEAARVLWLKTAADNCVYGADPDTLSILLRDLQDFQTKLNPHPVKSPAISSLHEAVDRAVQLLQQPVPSATDLVTGSEQESTMYTLRQLLAKIDSLSRSAAAEHKDHPLPGIEFLAEMIHRMELGTANLLDAVDFQQEHFQQTLVQQQGGLEKLQKELWRQQEVEKALRTQLSACPSKEDTLRLVHELHDQIKATTADSSSRMLDTVDDLKYRMAGLPNAHMLEQLAIDFYAKTDQITQELDTTAGKLAHDLRQKADRVEVDRLHSLLESGNGTHAPPASLTKSPLRCLSCDQHLPFAQAPHDDCAYPELASNPGSPTTQRPGSPPRSPPSSPPRPIVYQNQQQPQNLWSYPYQQQSAYPQRDGVYDDLGINMGLLEEMFAASTSALERRRQQRQRLQLQLLSPQTEYDSAWSIRNPTFLNIDDGRNRIPLRKTLLSDHVIYGPAITPGAFKKKPFSRPDEGRNERPKTAALPERRSGGEIITRTSSSTVIVRPFAELAGKRLNKR
ncbi:hypothetical protein PRNP1_007431 [Phytophthora ramorum]